MAKPGVPPSLNQARIIDEAFKMIDENGLDSFSMRTLARSLGSSPMTLYTYFDSKDEILLGVAQKLRSMYDTKPIPNEHWDATIRRIASSIRSVALAHPHIFRTCSGWMDEAKETSRRIYQIHHDQGIPIDIFRFLLGTLEAYLTGFIHQEMAQNSSRMQKSVDDGHLYIWLDISRQLYNDQSFINGLNFIIEGVKDENEEAQECWVTPEDESTWTWYR